MKLPITTSHTSYVEFETPCYYQSKYGTGMYKIYENGYISVSNESIHNFYLEDYNTHTNQYVIKQIRELLEDGIPVTKQEFEEQFEITSTHLNIIAK